MIKQRIILFGLTICFFVNILISGCVSWLSTKSGYTYHGTFVFFENTKKINGSVSSSLYTKISDKLETIIFDFGFIEDKEISDIWLKKKNLQGTFFNYSGSDATISLVLINRVDFFGIALDDYTYTDKPTDFIQKLIQDIILELKKEFEFSQIVFEETVVSPFI